MWHKYVLKYQFPEALWMCVWIIPPNCQKFFKSPLLCTGLCCLMMWFSCPRCSVLWSLRLLVLMDKQKESNLKLLQRRSHCFHILLISVKAAECPFIASGQDSVTCHNFSHLRSVLFFVLVINFDATLAAIYSAEYGSCGRNTRFLGTFVPFLFLGVFFNLHVSNLLVRWQLFMGVEFGVETV